MASWNALVGDVHVDALGLAPLPTPDSPGESGAARVAAPARGVFIPVATPGIGVAGHLFRTDGVVALPLAWKPKELVVE